MGTYINPQQSQTKEEYIEKNAKEIHSHDFLLYKFSEEKNVIILFDNGWMTAALVCDTEKELAYMKKAIIEDPRPKKFYEMDKKLWKKAV